MDGPDETQPQPQESLEDGEALAHHVETVETVITVTDRRLILTEAGRVTLDLPFSGLRRIELDIEHGRPSTLVLVPHEPRHVPQVLSVEAGSLHQVAAAIATIGLHLSGATLPD